MQPDFSDARLTASLERLLGAEVLTMERVGSGGNNRVYRADLHDGRRMAVKCYPSQEEDPRDRLGTEYGALVFLRSQGVGDVTAGPIASKPDEQYAVYKWIEGEPVNAQEPGLRCDDDMEALLGFIGTLHRLTGISEASRLRAASGACLSGRALLDLIAEARQRLEEVSSGHEDLADYLKGDFDPFFKHCEIRCASQYEAAGLDLEHEIPLSARTLSPSDFSFHNARRREDGRVVFLDLEYFGWDDPVKLASDVLWHPGTILSAEEKKQFMAGMNSLFGQDAEFPARFSALFPLVGLRWCLILLNEFLPEKWYRRAFAGHPHIHETARARQLAKARGLLDVIRKDFGEKTQ